MGTRSERAAEDLPKASTCSTTHYKRKMPKSTRRIVLKRRNAGSSHVIAMKSGDISRHLQKINRTTMKYALLVHESQEYFTRRKEAGSIAAGRAYGEALQAAGVFVGGAGLESPQAATTV